LGPSPHYDDVSGTSKWKEYRNSRKAIASKLMKRLKDMGGS